jgi:iron complex transport system substrate-binding protein
VERAGGVNIGAQRIPGHTGVLNSEFVLSSDPDVIVATGSNWTYSSTIKDSYASLGLNADAALARERLRGLTATPGFAGLKAVQNKRFHVIWHQFYGSPYHFAALQQLAKWQHPDTFADLDPEASLREFYTRFLPIPLTGAFWVSLSE